MLIAAFLWVISAGEQIDISLISPPLSVIWTIISAMSHSTSWISLLRVATNEILVINDTLERWMFSMLIAPALRTQASSLILGTSAILLFPLAGRAAATSIILRLVSRSTTLTAVLIAKMLNLLQIFLDLSLTLRFAHLVLVVVNRAWMLLFVSQLLTLFMMMHI